MARMGSDKLGRRLRRQFTDEFRAGAVRLVLDEGKTTGDSRSVAKLSTKSDQAQLVGSGGRGAR